MFILVNASPKPPMSLLERPSEGRGAFRTFEASMADDLRQRRALQKDLEAAINEGQLTPVPSAADFLVLWDHQERAPCWADHSASVA